MVGEVLLFYKNKIRSDDVAYNFVKKIQA